MEYESPEKQHAVFVSLDERYLTGIPSVDEQHKTLVELCNKLYNTVMKERGSSSGHYTDHVKEALETCTSYAQTHFSHEEKLMKACNYSGYTDHKFQHDQFVKRVIEETRYFYDMNLEKALGFLSFLKEWILSHIAHEDRLFVPALKQYLLTLQKNKPSDSFGIKS